MNDVSPWAMTAAMQTVACPKCGMPPNVHCKTPRGKKAECHWQRGKLYLDTIGREEWNKRHVMNTSIVGKKFLLDAYDSGIEHLCEIVGVKENGSLELIPEECCCGEDQGNGYTYSDEYGCCPRCDKTEPWVESLENGKLVENLS